jgi:hypothetical protein
LRLPNECKAGLDLGEARDDKRGDERALLLQCA